MSKSVLPSDIAFLTDSGFSTAALLQIVKEAAEFAVYPHMQALANGQVAENVYYEALARAHRLSFAAETRGFSLLQDIKDKEVGIACRAGLVRVMHEGRMIYLYAPYGRDLAFLLARLKETPALRERFVVTTPALLRKFLLEKIPRRYWRMRWIDCTPRTLPTAPGAPIAPSLPRWP